MPSPALAACFANAVHRHVRDRGEPDARDAVFARVGYEGDGDVSAGVERAGGEPCCALGAAVARPAARAYP